MIEYELILIKTIAMLFKSKLLSSLNIEHGFFSKINYVDKNVLQKYRNNEDVSKKPKHINQALEYFPKKVTQFICHQVHENNCCILQKESDFKEIKNIKADALITNNQNQLLTVVTADCVPILLVDPTANIIVAIHSGWRSLLSGIINNTIQSIIKLGGTPNNIICAIGPCIHQKNYEVDQEFYDKFIVQDPQNKAFFLASTNKDKFLFNLPSCVIHNLEQCGVATKNIEQLPLNTYEMEETFFSYRRYTKLKEDFTGLQMSCIMLK